MTTVHHPGQRNGDGFLFADDKILALFGRLPKFRKARDGFTACCPAHDDREPSLSIGVGADGDKILLRCHAGCSTGSVVRSMGLNEKDLFLPGDHAAGQRRNGAKPANNAKTYATAADAIAAVDSTMRSRHAAKWSYHDAAGEIVGYVLRYSVGPAPTPGEKQEKTFRPVAQQPDGSWTCGAMPHPRPLYRLPDMLKSSGTVYVTEGEKAADAVASVGLIATTFPGGAGAVDRASWQPLAGRKVVILPDNDQAGKKCRDAIIRELSRLTPSPAVTVLELPDLPDKGDAFEHIDRRRAEGKSDTAIRQEIEALAVKPDEPQEQSGYRFQVLTSTDFFSGDFRPTWLLKRMLVKNQPAIFGAPKKSLKTSFGIDLAISLATGGKFLGVFDAYSAVRTAFVSGESGEHTIQETALRICEAKGVIPGDLNVLWGFDLPQLSNTQHIKELCEGIETHEIEVLILDPLYLCLLAGDSAHGLDAANLFHTGPLFRQLAKRVLAAGCTPIMIHHAVKHLPNPGEPMELESLAYSGCAEFARQWLLLSRREAYNPDLPGSHKLWMGVGGSCGQSGLWAVDVQEGELREDFGGRRWEVTVSNSIEARQDEQAQQRAERLHTQAAKDQEDDATVLVAIDKLYKKDKSPVTKRAIRALVPRSNEWLGLVLSRLLHEGLIETLEVEVICGRGRSMKSDAYRRIGAVF